MSTDDQASENAPERNRVVGRRSESLGDQPTELRPEHLPGGEAPEDQTGVPGAEGGSGSDSADVPPGFPARDSSPLGDTDQHSDA